MRKLLLAVMTMVAAVYQGRTSFLRSLVVLVETVPDLGRGGLSGHLVAWVAQHRRFILRVTLHPDGWKGFILLPQRWVVEIIQS